MRRRFAAVFLGDLRCLIYLDDISFHPMTFDLELRRLRLVFVRLRAVNLKLSTEKCELFRQKVKFLGPGSVRMELSKGCSKLTGATQC